MTYLSLKSIWKIYRKMCRSMNYIKAYSNLACGVKSAEIVKSVLIMSKIAVLNCKIVSRTAKLTVGVPVNLIFGHFFIHQKSVNLKKTQNFYKIYFPILINIDDRVLFFVFVKKIKGRIAFSIWFSRFAKGFLSMLLSKNSSLIL